MRNCGLLLTFQLVKFGFKTTGRNPSCSVEVAASKKGATQLLVSRRDLNPRGFGGEVPQAIGVTAEGGQKAKVKKQNEKGEEKR
jgi:hypothetical protein